MADPICAVMFDLGKVLIDFDHLIAASKIAASARKTPQEIFDLFYNSSLVQEFEAGKVSPEDFFSRVRAQLHLEMSFDDFVGAWNDIFFISDQNRSVYALAKRLRSRYTIALLSNVNRLHFEYLQKHFPVFDVFHHIFTSYQLGMVKPEPRIYLTVLELLGLRPQEVFYVDDRPELIAQASVLGIRAFVYTGIRQLEQDLVSCGIRAGE